jgi:hypothetical protein
MKRTGRRKGGSPKSATRIDKHFDDPEDEAREALIEARLNEEFENPVNAFIGQLGSPDFVASDLRRKQLAFYVQLLFQRSQARRKASSLLTEVTHRAFRSFLANERQIQTVMAKWNIDMTLRGIPGPLITREQVIASAQRQAARIRTERNAQSSYISTLEHMMSSVDDRLLTGEWNYLRTTISNPFVISDAPVVTWERLEDRTLNFGLGFHRPNVEVLLPISPEVCLHILPNVERTNRPVRPSVREVNIAQAAFAGRFCFSNIFSDEINQIFQINFGSAELGVKSFTVWHRDYSNAIFDILMTTVTGRPACDYTQ